MKKITYQQFCKKVINELGHGINLTSCSVGVMIEVENDDSEVLVGIGHDLYLLEIGSAFHRLDEREQKKLYKVATAYAATPTDQRFKQKKYRYRLPMLHGDYNYINLGNNDKMLIDDLREVGEWRTSFTEREIKNLPFEKQRLFEVAVQEEVVE